MKNLYIHIPFCSRKCDYCAFYSQTDCSRQLKQDYINYLDSIFCKNAVDSFETIYIGGGTPTIFELADLEKLLASLHKYIDFSQIKEFSIESNPETLDADKIFLLQDYGVSRLSMGVQSFQEKFRLTLGRHTSQSAIEKAVALLQKYPFKHFNIDLIYGIPYQTVKDFEHDLLRVREAGCDHFSAYNLTIEEQTALAGEGMELDEDAACLMYETAGSFKPFERYEISNYALSCNSRCLHNSNVWSGGTLLGIGPSASSFDGVDRWTQVSDLALFMNGAAPEIDHISTMERQMEIFAVNLRTVDGWKKSQWEKIFPFSWDLVLKKALDVAKLYPDAWSIDNECIRLTDHGLLFWNEISMELL